MKIKSDFALLDVLKGAKKLRNAVSAEIPVVIRGHLATEPWGEHDGTSQEFGVTVASVLVEPRYAIVVEYVQGTTRVLPSYVHPETAVTEYLKMIQPQVASATLVMIMEDVK